MAGINLESVSHAFAVILRDFELHQHHHQPGRVIARQLRVREAGRVLVLLRLSLPGVAGAGQRAIENRRAIQAMARAADTLNLLKDPVLPEVEDHPTMASLLLLLTASARELRQDGRAAGGSFQAAAAEVAHSIDLYVHGAQLHPRYDDYAPLLHAVDTLKRRVDALLKATHTLRHEDLAEEEVAAHGEEVAEEAAAGAQE